MLSREAMKRWFVPVAALMVALGVLLGSTADSLTVCMGLCGLALLSAVLLQERMRILASWVTICFIGLCAGQIGFHPALPAEGTYVVSGIVSQELRQGDGTQHKTILRSVTLDGQPFRSGAYWSFYTNAPPENLTPGVRVTMTARVYHPQRADNPGGFDFRQYLLPQGVTLGVYGMEDLQCEAPGFHPWSLLARARHALVENLCRTMGEEAGSYAAAMLLGERSLMPDEDQQAFRQLGIAHVLSVSGFHVGVLFTLLSALCSLFHFSAKRRLPLLTTVLFLYALLTGMNAPVVRAVLLLLLTEYGETHGRQRLGLHALSLACIIQLLLSPAQIMSASFHLSYGALLGLLLIAPCLQRLLPETLPLPPKFRRALCLTLSAQLGILLPSLYWFHELPVLGVVFNLLLMAVFSVLLLVYWAALLLMAVPMVGMWVGRAAGYLTAVISAGVHLADGAPWLMLHTVQANLLTAIGWLLLMVGLCCIWPRTGKRQAAMAVCGAVVLAVSLVPLPYTGTRYIQLSVGSEDAAVLLDGGQVYAIDTGEDGQTLATYLSQRGYALDGLILTHLHTDHAGGIAALLEEHITIRRCYLPFGAEDAELNTSMQAQLDTLKNAGIEVVHLSRGDVIPLPHGSLTAVWPEAGRVRPGQDANLYSMALLCRLHQTTLLLTGDLDGTYENYAAVPADVLKAAHHGSASSTSPAFLQAVSPQCVLVSGGDEKRLSGVKSLAASLPVYGTYEHGAICVDITAEGYTVVPYR